MIYAIRATGTQFIKFGKARSVGKRLVEIQSSSPFELFIEVVADWPNIAEKAIHSYLEPMFERGEWFRDGLITRNVMQWMTIGEDGLHFLQRETGRTLKFSKEELRTAPRVSIARTREPKELRLAKRLAQRQAWWAWQERVQPQQSSAAITHDHGLGVVSHPSLLVDPRTSAV